MANFVGFEPAEYEKKMKTLNEVIKLKARNKQAAEEAQGYKVEAVLENERRAKPIQDELRQQNALMLTYNSNKDILEAKRQLAAALKLKNDADADAALSPPDQGKDALAEAHGLQLVYADAKLKLLEAMRDSLKSKNPSERAVRTKNVEDRLDKYQTAFDEFIGANIPVGFIQVVDIRTIPDQPQQNPGAPSSTVNLPKTRQQGLLSPTLSAADKIFDMYNNQDQYPNVLTSDKILAMAKAQNYNVDYAAALTRKKNNKGTQSPVVLVYFDKNQYRPIKALYSPVDVVFNVAPPNPIEIPPQTMLNFLTVPVDSLSEEDLGYYIAAIYKHTNANAYDDVIATDFQLDRNPNFAVAMQSLTKLFPQLQSGPLVPDPNAPPQTSQAPDPNAPPTGTGILSDMRHVLYSTPKKQVRGPPRFKLGPSGEYGNVRVDMPALLNRGRVRVMRGGSVVLDEVEENVDGFGLSRLITKRVMQKTVDAAPPKVRKQYERLNKLAAAAAEITKKAGNAKGSGVKSVKKPENIVVVGNGSELAQRLKIATGLYAAGNRSSENVQLITELAHAMLKMGKISHERYADILETYVAE